jgi:CRP-like cAMP-binding protein
MSKQGDQLAAVLSQFENSWKRGIPLSIREVLNKADLSGFSVQDAAYRMLVSELVKREMEQRWESGDHADDSRSLRIEAYLDQFEDVPFGEETIMELVEHEYSLRHANGDWPEIEEYVRRFPQVAETARRRLKNLRDDLVTQTSIKELFVTPELMAAAEEPFDSEVAARAAPTCPDVTALTETLRTIRPFDELSMHVREAIATHATVREFSAGDVLLRQGEVADSLFILLEGMADVSLHEAGAVHSIARLDRKTVIGELGLVTHQVRSADVVAVTSGCAAIISKDHFEHIAGRYPRLSIAMSELIAERVGHLTIDVLCGKEIGPYRIHRRLGRGAMGIVYAAQMKGSGEMVALKMLRHDLAFDRMATERFHQEAEIVRGLCQDNLVQVYDEFSEYGTSFIAMELCDGPSLSDLLDHVGPLPLEVARQIIGQLAAGLVCAHEAGIAHRDLKPSNVLLTREGMVKIADFGLARCLTTDAAALTAFGQIVGTPRYMAPEQLAGERGEPKSDVFALGCIYFEMLAGRPVFMSSRFTQLLKERANFTMPEPNQIRPGLDRKLYRLLEALLEEDPDARDVDLSTLADWAAPVDLAALGVDGCAAPVCAVASSSDTHLDA